MVGSDALITFSVPFLHFNTSTRPSTVMWDLLLPEIKLPTLFLQGQRQFYISVWQHSQSIFYFYCCFSDKGWPGFHAIFLTLIIHGFPVAQSREQLFFFFSFIIIYLFVCLFVNIWGHSHLSYWQSLETIPCFLLHYITRRQQ